MQAAKTNVIYVDFGKKKSTALSDRLRGVLQTYAFWLYKDILGIPPKNTWLEEAVGFFLRGGTRHRLAKFLLLRAEKDPSLAKYYSGPEYFRKTLERNQ